MDDLDENDVLMNAWLEKRWMGRYAATLVDAGWGDMLRLKRSTAEERESIRQLFDRPGLRLKMRLLLEELDSLDFSSLDVQSASRRLTVDASAPPDFSSDSSDSSDMEDIEEEGVAAASPAAATMHSTGQVEVGKQQRGSAFFDAPQGARTSILPELPSDDSSDDDGPPKKAAPQKPQPSGVAARIAAFSNNPAVAGGGGAPKKPLSRIDMIRQQFEAQKREEEAAAAAAASASAASAAPSGGSKPHVTGTLKSRFAQFEGVGPMAGGQPPQQKPPVQPRPASNTAFRNKMANIGAALGGAVGGPPPGRRGGGGTQAPSVLMRADSERPPQGFQMPMTRDLVNPSKTGMLDKRGDGVFNKSWKRRYFILHERILYWLKSPDDAQPKGCIDLTAPEVSFVRIEAGVFEVRTMQKNYILRASDDSEMRDWLRAVEDAKHNVIGSHPSGNTAAERLQNVRVSDAEANRVLHLIEQGSMFIKYKHKKGKDRMIWCPNLDRINWGSADQRKVKGFIMASEVRRIGDGCFGASNNENAFTIFAAKRTLELEAVSLQEKRDWVRALELIVAAHQSD